MTDNRTGGGLQIIFAIFLGLMVTAFVGVGVYTFYPSPAAKYRDQIIKLDREQGAVRNTKPDVELTPEDRTRIQRLTDERDRIQDESNKANEGWAGRTSIILVVLATLSMAVSLITASALPVISNGLLLGGVFTMLYGVGWVIASGTSGTRFVVMTIALIITLGLGYMRFVRRKEAEARRIADRGAAPEGLSDLETRVAALEQRLHQAASALTSFEK